jgi:nudix-type nucleoside diphosphatase (YffH/AdpP family)
MKRKIKILDEKRIFNEFFKIDEGKIEEQKSENIVSTFSLFKLTRPNAVAVLIYNEDSNKVILVKQFRFPIAHYGSEYIIEAVAGKIDGTEEPKETAVREVFEEIGYKITKESLSNPVEIYPSPGYSTEKIYIFLAVVKDSDKVEGAGGGLEEEHESINIVELELHDFISKIKSNEIKDSKTIIAATLIRV